MINYVARLDATLRARREKTLPHQSQLKSIILNDGASKVMKNVDDNFRLTPRFNSCHINVLSSYNSNFIQIIKIMERIDRKNKLTNKKLHKFCRIGHE